MSARRVHREAWVDQLDALASALAEALGAAVDWAEAARMLGEAEGRAERARGRQARAEVEATATGEHARELHARASEVDAELAALRATLGASGAALVAQLEGLDRSVKALGVAQGELNDARAELSARLADARQRTATAAQDAEIAEAHRGAAHEALRALHVAGHLALAMGERALSIDTLTDAIEVARDARRDHAKVDASPAVGEQLENLLYERVEQLRRQIPREQQIEAERSGGLLRVRVRVGDEKLGLDDLEARMRAELEQQQRLLEEEERRVLSDFLTGATRRHLRERLVQSQELVDGANAVLRGCPTPQGTQIRLRWRLDEGAPADADRAVEALRKDSDAQTDGDRQALERFLQNRLTQARNQEGSLQVRMLELLDYRRWFHFDLETREPNAQWRKLTRKAHGAGSGGQKAVLLHLPLFAATSAFYQSAGPHAPRLVLMDEAFAGVDGPMRGELMGLMCKLDLDFVLTAFSEWGCYPGVDGVAIYHMMREPGMPGVLAERYVWDGHRRALIP